MSFKVGDEVVCVKKGVWHDYTGNVVNSGYPKYNEECVVRASYDYCGENIISLKGFYKDFYSGNFRKKQNHTYKNKATARLAGRMVEEKGIERIFIKETA